MKWKFVLKWKFVVALTLFSVIAQGQSNVSVTLSNPSKFIREDELIIFSRKNIENALGKQSSYTLTGKNENPIPVQLIDNNRDGQWDDLLFLYSFAPGEKASLKLSASDKESSITPIQRAHVRMRLKTGLENFGPNLTEATMPVRNPATDFSKQKLPLYLTEGPAWENDKVAFRLYFDVRNNKDIYGKTTSRMMMDTVGSNPKMSYHILNEWGMDVLHVVKSLGAGALALSVPQVNGSDTIIRLGGQNISKTVFNQLADGPIVGRFSLTYDWTINDKPVKIVEEISIWAGQHFYESKVFIEGAPAGAKLITGIADFYENTFDLIKEGKSVIGYSYGKQSENKDNLGLGVMVNNNDFATADSINRPGTDVNETYTISQIIPNSYQLYYRFYVGWERTANKFKSLQGFRNFLKQEGLKYSNPIVVKFSKRKN